jgi:tetratricopeptide (TPR) repeat protein
MKFSSIEDNIKKIKELLKYKFTNKDITKQVCSITLAVTIALSGSVYGIYRIEHKEKPTIVTITDNAAEVYFYEGNYDKAISEYLKIYENDNESPIWYMKISEIYSVKGDIESSRKYIQLAKELREKNISSNKEILYSDFSKKDAEVVNYIVFTELMNKDYEAALSDGEEGLKKYKLDKRIMKTLFTVYMTNGENEKAKQIIDEYPVDKTFAYDIAEHARMRMLVDQWEEGLEELREAWNIDKDEYKIFDIIAQISAFNKDMLLEKISLLSNKYPEESVYKIWLAKIYSMREETSEMAQKLLDEVSNKDVGIIEKVLIEAAVLQNTKQTEQADELINKLIMDYENDYRVLHTAGWFYLQKNELDKAMLYCKKSILKNKNYPDNYGFLMPEILKAMGKSGEGEPYFRTALFKEPYNYNIMLTLANFYWYTTKDSEKALEFFKFAEVVKPNDTEIKYNIALIHLTNQRDDEAVKILQECIKINPAVPKYHRTLGTIYILKGKNAEGIKEIRDAYQSDKEDILTLNNAGCYYITVEGYLERGVVNLKSAFEGINSNVDEYTKKTITDNYNKAKKLLDDYNNGNGNESLKIPEFILFY